MHERGTKPPDPVYSRLVCSLNQRTHVLGWSKVDGSAVYLPVIRKLKLVVTAHPSPKNKGPRFQDAETLDWPNALDLVGMRRSLEAKVKSFISKLSAKEVPDRSLLIEQCNPADDPDFLARVCQGCICPYCELSSVV